MTGHEVVRHLRRKRVQSQSVFLFHVWFEHGVDQASFFGMVFDRSHRVFFLLVLKRNRVAA